MYKPVPVDQEPKYENRFFVELPPVFEIESYLIQRITPPIFENYCWKNFEIDLIDVTNPSTSEKIYELIELVNVIKLGNAEILFSFTLKSLDSTGETVETWKVEVEELVSVNFGFFDHSLDGVKCIKMILKPFSVKII